MDPASIIRRSGQVYAQNVAVSFRGKHQTYADLFSRAIRLCNALKAAGAQPGDRIAMLGDNAQETVEQAAACALGNYPRATLYVYHPPSINRYLLELIDARVLLVQAKYYDALSPLIADLDRLTVLVFDHPDGEAGSYEQAIATASGEDVPVPVGPQDVHIIRFSSGTTGKPKAIFHSVERWMKFNDEWRWVTPMIDETSSLLAPAALAHLGVAFLWGFLTVGGRILPMPSFDPADTAALLESERISHVVMAPVMIRAVVADPSIRTRDLSALRCLLYSGSPISQNTMKSAIEVFGSTLHQLYGQSEAVPSTMLLPHQHVLGGTEKQARHLKSAGRSTPNCQVTIRDENGAVLPPETVGEIAVASPFTMSGIWNDPAATAARILPDGSVLTRDMGLLDADGFLYLVDRKDDMIVSGAYNIWPTELEEALSGHPAVNEVCVFGVPDEKWGETPKAVVVPWPDAHVTAEELIEHSRQIVGSIKKVTSVDFATTLPKTLSGKVLRGQLKEPFWRGRGSRISGS